MRRLLLAVIAGALVLLGSAAPAQAHAQLLGTSPGKGKTVAEPPPVVVLQFSEQVLTLGMLVQVTGPSGRVEDGSPKLAGAAVVQKLQAGLPAGDYEVAWRVTSDDGHPVSGTFDFTATRAGAGASSSAEPSVTATPAPTTAPSQTTVPPVTPVSQATGSGPSTGWTIAGIVIVVTGLGAGVFALTRPRRGSRSTGAGSDGAGPEGPGS